MENFRAGDKVIYLGCTEDQTNWASNDDPTKVLIKGYTYYIEKVEVHSWHTKLTLRNVRGKFNSVCFEGV
jgi:hypothetical protein